MEGRKVEVSEVEERKVKKREREGGASEIGGIERHGREEGAK